MAILWTFLATLLIADCVVNAKTIFEKVDTGYENSRIARFWTPKDDEILERRSTVAVGCDTGNTEYITRYPEALPGGTVTITLTGYEEPPSVSVAIASLDVDHTYNTRIMAEVHNVTASSFILKYYPFVDTIMYGIKLAWTACA